jgi:hypothetical protein
VVLNVDGAARLGDAAAVEAGGPAHALLATLDHAGRETGVPLRASATASDNRHYAAGLPTVEIGMACPAIQTPTETADRVQTDTLLVATRFGSPPALGRHPLWVVATVRHLAAPITGGG